MAFGNVSCIYHDGQISFLGRTVIWEQTERAGSFDLDLEEGCNGKFCMKFDIQ